MFGFNGWSSSIQNIQIDFVDENPQKGTISIGLSVVVRVTLRDGTYHEDTGYGGIENCKSKIAAFEKAKKEGTTDALKRALRNFGNVLGNCIYDKDYITKVSKVKAGTGKWDVNELYRHADYAPMKKEEQPVAATTAVPIVRPAPLVPEDSFEVMDFDEADFDDIGNPDEVTLPPDTGPPKGGIRPPISNINHHDTPSKPPQQRTDQNGFPPQPNQNMPNGNQPFLHARSEYVGQESNTISRSSSPGIASQHFAPPPPPQPPGPRVTAFFSARDADNLDGNNNPINPISVSKFNPHAESPSIRKTSGVDHSHSMALNRKTLKHEPLPKKPTDVETPAPVKTGAPTAAGGPNPMVRSMSTSAYRPPTRHGTPAVPGHVSTSGAVESERVLTAAKRAPLSDLSNVQSGPHTNGMANETPNVKRPRIGPGLSGHTNLENAEPTGG